MIKWKSILFFLLFFSESVFSQILLNQLSTGYTKPVDIKNCGDDRLFIVEQGGKIWIADTNGIQNSIPFLDIFSKIQFAGEQGLLGLAFAPDFLSSGYFYLDYTAKNTGETCISRFHVDVLTPDSADPNSEEILLRIYQPFPNHNGGHLGFGPDGYLYIGMGDGGNGGDPGNRAQNPDSLLGKMLRIEVDPSYPSYKIPPTNPFASDTTRGRPEIWATGLRNPWRWSFDKLNGDLWIGDVGQNLIEEIDRQPVGTAGLNYGWKCYEADSAFSSDTSCLPYSDYTPPVYQFDHFLGGFCSVTGGYVYRGARYQELYGKYFFTDFCLSHIQYLEANDSGGYTNIDLGLLGAASISAFGVDRHDELYCAAYNSGIIYKFGSADCTPVATINEGRDTIDDCGNGTIELSVPFDSSFVYWWILYGDTVANTSHFTATQDGKYFVYVANSSCTNSDSVYITFSSPVILNITNLDTLYCSYDAPITLVANYSPGIYSGPGINGDIFSPQSAGEGYFNISYSYTSPNNCLFVLNQPVHVEICFSVPENNWTKSLSFYPNPSQGYFHIRTFTNSEKKIKIEITDFIGRIVQTENIVFNTGENYFPIHTQLAKGMYLLHLSDEQSSTTLKILLQ